MMLGDNSTVNHIPTRYCTTSDGTIDDASISHESLDKYTHIKATRFTDSKITV